MLPFLAAVTNHSLQKKCSFHFLGKAPSQPTIMIAIYGKPVGNGQQKSFFIKPEDNIPSVRWPSGLSIDQLPTQ